jgi:nucleotide-binding universal stress UspA family protein
MAKPLARPLPKWIGVFEGSRHLGQQGEERMILIGVDFLDGSRAALDQARALSLAMEKPMEALYVREYGEGGRWQPTPDQLKWLECAKVAPSELHTRQGVPWVELVRYARERGADLIVAGRHGES